MRTRRAGKRSPKKGDTEVENARNAIGTAASSATSPAGVKGKAKATRGRAAASDESPKKTQKRSPSKGATATMAMEKKQSPTAKTATTAKKATPEKKESSTAKRATTPKKVTPEKKESPASKRSTAPKKATTEKKESPASKRSTTPKKATTVKKESSAAKKATTPKKAKVTVEEIPARTKRVPKKTKKQEEAEEDAQVEARATPPAKARKAATKRKATAEPAEPQGRKAKATKPKAAPARQDRAPAQAAQAAAVAPERVPGMDYVYLKCMKVGPKLRVRIITNGYNLQANCQFPRAIRVQGRTFRVPARVVSVAAGPAGKFFYRIPKESVEIVTAEEAANAPAPRMRPPEAVHRVAAARVRPATAAPAAPQEKPKQVFAVEECTICLDNASDIVFVPCGHMCVCAGCNENMVNQPCVMCRTPIQRTIMKSEMD